MAVAWRVPEPSSRIMNTSLAKRRMPINCIPTADVLTQPLEQGQSHLLLKLTNLHRHRWLGKIQPMC